MRDNLKRLAVSVTEAAELLGISKSTAYEGVRTGSIPYIRLSQRRIVILLAALEAMCGQTPPVIVNNFDTTV